MKKIINILLITLIFSTISFSAPLIKEEIKVKKVSSPFVIDGDLTDWKEIVPFFLISPNEIADFPEWNGPEDLSGIVYFAYDDNYLYFSAEVIDNIFCQPYNNELLWMGDSIRISFDTEDDALKKGYDEDDYEYGFALYNEKEIAWSWWKREPFSGKIEDFKLKIKKKENGLIYEVAIPWKNLSPFSIKENNKIGFCVLINDNDGGGRKGWIEYRKGIGGYKDPSEYANLVFVENLSKEERIKLNIVPLVSEFSDICNSKIYIFSTVNLQNNFIEVELSVLNEKIFKREKIKTDLVEGLNSINVSFDIKKLKEGSYKLQARIFNKDKKELSSDKKLITKIDIQKIDENVNKTKDNLVKLKKIIEKLQEEKIDTSYLTSSYTICENFCSYAIDDKNSKKIKRAKEVSEYILNVGKEALKNGKNLLKNLKLEKKGSRPSVLNLTIKDGGFYQGDTPVILSGVGHFGQVRKDIPKMQNYGFNIIQIEIGPSQVFEEEGKISENYLNNEILKPLKEAEKNNVAVNILLSPHYFPEWAKKKYKEVNSCGRGFLNYCILNPDARKILENYLRFVIPKISQYSSLHSYCLANEPQFDEKCIYAEEGFIKYLKNKYKGIKKLNEVWGENFKDFNEIEISYCKSKDNPAIKYDWIIYHYQVATDFFNFMKKIIREYDKKTPIHIKFMADVFSASEAYWGIDRETLGELCEISGNDSWIGYAPEDANYKIHWQNQAMFYDLLKSFQPNKPIFNSENHIIPDDNPNDFPYDYIYTALMEGFTQGMDASTIWVWERGEGPSLINNILTRPDCVDDACCASLDALRLAKYIKKITQAQREVFILFSTTSLILSPRYLAELKKLYEVLFFLDIPIGFISEKQIKEGKLKDCKLLLVPRASYVQEETYKGIINFVNSDGNLFLIEGSFLYDEAGRKREIPPELFNKQNVFYYSKSPETTKEYFEILNNIIEKINVKRLVKSIKEDGSKIWGLKLRAIEDEGGIAVYIVNLTNRNLKFQLKTEKKIKEIFDLTDLKKIDSKFLEYPPLEPHFLKLSF